MTKLLSKSQYPAFKGLWDTKDIIKYIINKEAEVMAKDYERPLCADDRPKAKKGFVPGIYNFVLGLRV